MADGFGNITSELSAELRTAGGRDTKRERVTAVKPFSRLMARLSGQNWQ